MNIYHYFSITDYSLFCIFFKIIFFYGQFALPDTMLFCTYLVEALHRGWCVASCSISLLLLLMCNHDTRDDLGWTPPCGSTMFVEGGAGEETIDPVCTTFGIPVSVR